MDFKLTILGSASALPASSRNPSAQALSVHGRLFLIDCGEGTQQRIRQEHLSFVKIEAVFISHIHGDHCFGLFGLLSTMSLYHRVAPLHIYGPQNLGPILKFYMSYFGQDLGYEIVCHPLSCKEAQIIVGAAAGKAPSSAENAPSDDSAAAIERQGPELSSPKPFFSEGRNDSGPTYESKFMQVTAFPLNHKIDCYGFRFDEVVTPRRNPWKPRSYAYVSDTAPFEELPGYVSGVDLLYHEATYPAELQNKAEQYFHSTTAQAAECAKAAGAGKLLVGHFSSRVKDISLLEAECREIFPETIAVNDGDIFEIPYIREYEKMSSDYPGGPDLPDSTV